MFIHRTPLSLDSSNIFDCVPNMEAGHNTQWNSAVCTPEPGLFSAFHGLLPQDTSFSLLCIAHREVSVGLVLWCRWDLIWEMAASQAEFVTHSNMPNGNFVHHWLLHQHFLHEIFQALLSSPVLPSVLVQDDLRLNHRRCEEAVSYTHLTLPTSDLV